MFIPYAKLLRLVYDPKQIWRPLQKNLYTIGSNIEDLNKTFQKLKQNDIWCPKHKCRKSLGNIKEKTASIWTLMVQIVTVIHFGDPYGNRTHVTTVKGWCLNRLTKGPSPQWAFCSRYILTDLTPLFFGSGGQIRTNDLPGMNRPL